MGPAVSSATTVRATLAIESGTLEGRVVEIGPAQTHIGRVRPCDVILASSGVSRHHARVERRADGFWLEDLGSLNGTFVNGQRVHAAQQLFSGDHIQIHDSLLTFTVHDPEPAADDDAQVAKSLSSTHTSIVAALDVRCGTQSRVEVNPEIKLHALLSIIRSGGAAGDMEQTLAEVLDRVFDIFPQADHGFILLDEPDREGLVPRAIKHRSPEKAQQTLGPINNRVALESLREGKAILSADTPGHGAIGANETIFDIQLRAVLCAPLMTPFTEPLGVLQLATDDPERQFAQTDLDVLASIGLLVGQLVEYALRFERKGAADALQRSESRFRALVERSYDSVAVIGADGTIDYTTPSVAQQLGFTPDQVIGRSAFDLVHLDDLELVRGLFEELLAQAGTSRTSEYRICHADGSWRWLEVTGTNLLHDPAVQGIVCNYRDVSDRRAAGEALRQSKERLRIALDTARLGAWQLNLATGGLDCSPICKANFGRAAAADFSYGEMVAAIHPDDRAAVDRAQMQAIRGEADYEAEYRVFWPDGGLHWVLASGRALSGDGQPEMMVGVTLDITARKQLEHQRLALLEEERVARAEAERLSCMKDEFLATLSHELRTPLNAIVGWSDLLQTGTLKGSEVTQGIETIQRNARLQTQIIEDLLDMSRIISGRIRLDMQPIRVEGLIAAAVETAKPAANSKQIAIEVSCDGPPAISGDPARLQQVLWNLLSNAIKFTPPQGRICVSARRESDQLELCVTDSGEGIAENFLPYVFERFRQADASSTRRHGGLGLGLAIVKQLVELHGGTVQADSDGPGQGSTFLVRLPGCSPAEAERIGAGPQTVAVAPERSLLHVRVLVVDDELDSRELVRRILSEAGALVECVESAEAALERFAIDPPTVMVADIGMPNVDGYQLLRQVRSLPPERGGAVPAAAITAFAHAEARRRSFAAGYQFHLAKPVERAGLLKVVAKLAELAAHDDR